ncbi:Glyoxylase, beta-lactamase superfamily II [Seinonella peptonophila]|uniref:Glyoxylase, beta-lactamase superfamily II n=1 Tax=Seinonella peptonophila TaxID=112248 RepID=A0A1M4V0S0_9BACL|nr:MBL fold metallo-hydrolase [Seinonella peptonophila]SHE62566.1 Glyoxylase, beta-lactamase superfamily II [Seinonella peptonophila]
MNIETFTLGPLGTHTYLLTDEQRKEAIVLDPGYDPVSLLQKIEEYSCQVQAIVLTHAHFDHIGGLNQLREYTKAKVYLHQQEASWLADPSKNGSAQLPLEFMVTCESADILLKGNEKIRWIGREFQILHTPGHSPGSISLYHEPYLFSGDAIFRQSIGRTDLYQGNYDQLITSIHRKLLTLPSETTIFPGHGSKTNIDFERKYNPFLSD